jgi:hypothetical protein
MIDPSGKMSLNEKLVTGFIVGNLALMAVGTMTEPGRDVYSWFAEKVFPDAFILGGNITVSVNYMIVTALLGTYLNVSLPPLASPVSLFGGIGFEILMSVSSAQCTVFAPVWVFGVEFHKLLGISPVVYSGYVWNLWDDRDYIGWFDGFSLGHFGMFWDTDDWFGGPWGIAFPMFPKSQMLKWRFAAGRARYSLWKRKNFAIEYEVIPLIFLAEMIDLVLNNHMAPTPINITTIMLRFTLWNQTGIAKTIWNRRTGFTIEERRTIKRPVHFRSGPKMPFFY